MHLLEFPTDELELSESVDCVVNRIGFVLLVLKLEFPPHINRVKLPKGFERKSKEFTALRIAVVCNLETCSE